MGTMVAKMELKITVIVWEAQSPGPEGTFTGRKKALQLFFQWIRAAPLKSSRQYLIFNF